MIRLIRSLALLFVVLVIAQLLSRVPTREIVVLLICLMVILERTSQKQKPIDRNVLGCAVMAVCVLYFHRRPDNATALAQPVETAEAEPAAGVSIDRNTGNVRKTFDVDRLRQMKADLAKLRQENPELWRQKIRERGRFRTSHETIPD